MVHYQGSFIYFGGVNSSKIKKFDSITRQWSDLGNLVTARQNHGADFDGAYFLVVGGGNGSFETEKCSLTESKMTCHLQAPTLYKYEYPELFHVQDDFCKST